MADSGRFLAEQSISRRRFFAMAGACLAGAGVALCGCAVPAPSSVAGSSKSAGAAGPESHSGAASGAAPGAASGSAGPVPKSAQLYEQISKTLFAFDTVVVLKASCAQETMDALAARCEYFESKFSRTIEASDIGRINAAAGAPVEVAPETADIIQKALAYCEESRGFFDITIGAVSALWDFKKGIVADAGALAEGVKHVDYRKVSVEGTTVTLEDPQAKLDLGGIAKGYIADDLCRMLVEAGCDSGFVNLGGNVKTVGVKPDGSPWHVGIQDPNDEKGAVVAAAYAQASGTSIVTSGLYERQFTKDGKRYWHILDPKTGYPVETDLISATIISDASIDGDGYTKPLFKMGLRGALDWIESASGIEGLVVGMDGKIVQSSGCSAELLED